MKDVFHWRSSKIEAALVTLGEDYCTGGCVAYGNGVCKNGLHSGVGLKGLTFLYTYRSQGSQQPQPAVHQRALSE